MFMFLQKKRARNNKIILKALVYLLEFLALLLVLYLIFSPLYPRIKYQTTINNQKIREEAKNEDMVKQKVEKFEKIFPQAGYAISPNRLIITKIGVNAPIVESKNEKYGLNRGAWRIPESSAPNKGGNTVITGHRFKYLPPNNVTFYLMDKLEVGDVIAVIWQKKNYYYRVKEAKIVPATDLSILDQTTEPILTLFTCDPIYSTKNRLVVIGELIKK